MALARIDVTAYDHPDAVVLVAEVQQEYVVRYGGEDGTPVDPADFAPPRGLFLVAYVDGTPAACGGWRAHGTEVEVKRMYVSPAFRGRGLARAVLAELERTAGEDGYRRIVLETGSKQPEAIALYRSSGYEPVPRFGFYANAPGALHLGKAVGAECPSTR
ncbi:GNAT family N-acetyltransferase [Actinophytocola oryzae]|uniref:Acetyltransferase (GNAT) family protein n=1 Tax=Actinophytocola oryzae TaxID=502181 RepID=A0A4R7UXN1_9PSEU|nr:GNAT family N-acetyltransferase [Actinophytocola oryzae]TDV39836.1 acetyltransferase (GNAT) family protein [Actinophytocola oryzae]